MHKIDSPGATVLFTFTEGNPALSILATEVSDDWLNDVQGELVTVIEGQGIVLNKGTITQLQSAIFSMIGQGGTNIKLDPLLNNTADQVITGLLFDKTITKAAFILVDVDRRTDSSNVQETQIWFATHDTADDIWRVSQILTAFDDADSVPNITVAGQVRITTGDLTGTNYFAEARVAAIFKIAL